MGQDINRQVKRRRVFYIPGYDPIHPRRYRELYRRESVLQAKVSNYKINMKPKKPGTGNSGWSVRAQMERARVDADIEVLLWSDIVQKSMKTSIAATYWQLVRTAWVYITSGTLWRLMKLRKGPVIAALYPVLMLLMQFFTAVLAWYLVAKWSAYLFNPALGLWLYVLTNLIGAGVGYLILKWFKDNDQRFYAYYLMHDYAYSASSGGAVPKELEARIRTFTDTIAEALDGDVDEVLVVGHSSGAHIGVSIMADLICSGHVKKDGPALSFLTLGQVVPMVSFLPKSQRLRSDLKYLSARDEVTWMDVSAPGDGAAFALCDPVSVTGVAPKNKKWPLVFSAAFTKSLSAERRKELRWSFFRLHFQYLCAFDRPTDYDYFKITAGPKTLGARFAKKPASKSRIETPVNKYTSVTG